jgi:hypothetical protein
MTTPRILMTKIENWKLKYIRYLLRGKNRNKLCGIAEHFWRFRVMKFLYWVWYE